MFFHQPHRMEKSNAIEKLLRPERKSLVPTPVKRSLGMLIPHEIADVGRHALRREALHRATDYARQTFAIVTGDAEDFRDFTGEIACGRAPISPALELIQILENQDPTVSLETRAYYAAQLARIDHNARLRWIARRPEREQHDDHLASLFA